MKIQDLKILLLRFLILKILNRHRNFQLLKERVMITKYEDIATYPEKVYIAYILSVTAKITILNQPNIFNRGTLI